MTGESAARAAAIASSPAVHSATMSAWEEASFAWGETAQATAHLLDMIFMLKKHPSLNAKLNMEKWEASAKPVKQALEAAEAAGDAAAMIRSAETIKNAQKAADSFETATEAAAAARLWCLKEPTAPMVDIWDSPMSTLTEFTSVPGGQPQIACQETRAEQGVREKTCVGLLEEQSDEMPTPDWTVKLSHLAVQRCVRHLSWPEHEQPSDDRQGDGCSFVHGDS
ncbi:unnamed protein product [Vitrella brassicaformis CCMP3155]|uniref:Uncharacterized protein n=1 Tax=Vitrella brassicaformis (strain CCMP3155) TaxID=1169540 RepID=A0A0G4EVL4_VITBC|nr:unnamed protein product [Vitrella brassicaformis CCMP3155]|eukprot:CEM02125.1 unnamed protein product [Vitrella brassicaformis CCMP3155]